MKGKKKRQTEVQRQEFASTQMCICETHFEVTSLCRFGRSSSSSIYVPLIHSDAALVHMGKMKGSINSVRVDEPLCGKEEFTGIYTEASGDPQGWKWTLR